jgi:hypothetical protein
MAMEMASAARHKECSESDMKNSKTHFATGESSRKTVLLVRLRSVKTYTRAFVLLIAPPLIKYSECGEDYFVNK